VKGFGMILSFALRSLAAGIAILFIVYSFMAYLDPAVFIPALNMASFCK
jgi:hypothetical protein